MPSGLFVSPCVPQTAVRVQILEHIQMSAPPPPYPPNGGGPARQRVPRGAVLVFIHEAWQRVTACGARADVRPPPSPPVVTVTMHVDDGVDVATTGGRVHHLVSPHGPRRGVIVDLVPYVSSALLVYITRLMLASGQLTRGQPRTFLTRQCRLSRPGNAVSDPQENKRKSKITQPHPQYCAQNVLKM